VLSLLFTVSAASLGVYKSSALAKRLSFTYFSLLRIDTWQSYCLVLMLALYVVQS
jgi:hypothetical protein